MSTEPAPAGGRNTAGILLAIGGALAVIGAFLPWAKVAALGQAQSFKGFDVTNSAYVTLILGVILLGVGISLAVAKPAAARPVGILAIVGSLGIVGLGSYWAFGLKDRLIDAIEEQFNQEIPAEAAALLDVSAGIGVYLTILAGVVALAGAVMALRSAPATAGVDTIPPPPPAFGTPGPPPPGPAADLPPLPPSAPPPAAPPGAPPGPPPPPGAP